MKISDYIICISLLFFPFYLWSQDIDINKVHSLRTGKLLISPSFKNSNEKLIIFIHFHGKASIVQDAFLKSQISGILITFHLGMFSSPYREAFSDSTLLDSILVVAIDKIKTLTGKSYNDNLKIFLTSFSAGYGAIREIIKFNKYYEKIDGIILIDGLHTDYVQSWNNKFINPNQMGDFLRFARDAIKFKKQLIITHSEITPNGYSSTKETAQYLIDSTSTEKIFVEKMYNYNFIQKYYAINGNFRVFGFYGDTAKDHLNHFYNLDKFLNMIQY